MILSLTIDMGISDYNSYLPEIYLVGGTNTQPTYSVPAMVLLITFPQLNLLKEAEFSCGTEYFKVITDWVSLHSLVDRFQIRDLAFVVWSLLGVAVNCHVARKQA